MAQLAANVLAGKGKHGFNDKHRGQLMVMTGMNNSSLSIASHTHSSAGPTLLTGDELAKAASEALGAKMEFEDVNEYV